MTVTQEQRRRSGISTLRLLALSAIASVAQGASFIVSTKSQGTTPSESLALSSRIHVSTFSLTTNNAQSVTARASSSKSGDGGLYAPKDEISATSIRIQYMATFVLSKSIALMLKRAQEQVIDEVSVEVASEVKEASLAVETESLDILFDETSVVEEPVKTEQEKTEMKTTGTITVDEKVTQDAIPKVEAEMKEEESVEEEPLADAAEVSTKMEDMTYPIRIPDVITLSGPPLKIESENVPPIREPIAAKTIPTALDGTPVKLGAVPVQEGIKKLKRPQETSTAIEEGESEPLLESHALQEVSPEEAVNELPEDAVEHIRGAVPVQEGIKALKKPQDTSTAIEEGESEPVPDSVALPEFSSEEVADEKPDDEKPEDIAEEIQSDVPVGEESLVPSPDIDAGESHPDEPKSEDVKSEIKAADSKDEASSSISNSKKKEVSPFAHQSIKIPDDALDSIMADIDSLKDTKLGVDESKPIIKDSTLNSMPSLAVGNDKSSKTGTSGLGFSPDAKKISRKKNKKNSGRLQATANNITETETKSIKASSFQNLEIVTVPEAIDSVVDTEKTPIPEASNSKVDTEVEQPMVEAPKKLPLAATIVVSEKMGSHDEAKTIEGFDEVEATEEPERSKEMDAIEDPDVPEKPELIREPEASEEPEAVKEPQPQVLSRAESIAQALRQPKSEDDEANLSKKYGEMNIEERAYTILYDLGVIGELL